MMRNGVFVKPSQVAWRTRIRWLLAAVGAIALMIVGATFLPRTSLLPATMRQPNPPPFLLARSRDGRWLQDITYLANELPRLHVDPFHNVSKSEFRLRVAALQATIAMFSDDEIRLRLMALVAMIGEGHTTLNFTPFYQGDNGWRLYPLSVAWLEEGWYVVGAQAENQQLLGAQLVAINDMPINDVFDRVAPLVAADNDVQRRTTGATLLLTAEVLAGLDIVENMDSARFAFILLEGTNVEVPLAATPPATLQLQGIQPQVPMRETPLALRNPDRWYWYESLPAQNALYFQYDVCAEMADQSFADFSAELFQRVDSEKITRIIVDVRNNGGGNSAVLRPFLAGLAERPHLAVYVLIGRRTFSSALINAIELDQQANALLVGEPTGGRPNHYGEVRSFNLPNSQLQISYSTKYFRMLPDADPPSLEPEIATPVTIANQLAARDAALSTALEHVP